MKMKFEPIVITTMYNRNMQHRVFGNVEKQPNGVGRNATDIYVINLKHTLDLNIGELVNVDLIERRIRFVGFLATDGITIIQAL